MTGTSIDHFGIHSIESAPAESRPKLEELRGQLGFVPNLAATMAASPALLEGFTTLRRIFAQGSFSGVERELIATTVAVELRCEYCVAAHSTAALRHGAEPKDLQAIRSGQLPVSPRLRALCRFARQVVRDKGQIAEVEVATAVAAGLQPGQLLEIFVGIAMTSLASYTHLIAGTAVDDAFQSEAWSAPGA